VTSQPPAEIQTLIDAHVKGFNAQDNDLFLGVFGDTAIIIDGIAPDRPISGPISRRIRAKPCQMTHQEIELGSAGALQCDWPPGVSNYEVRATDL
jgi:hypothetical protein